ncbi:Importin-7 [Geodia barretti]|nr:Importin-7 [Geodia barretti]
MQSHLRPEAVVAVAKEIVPAVLVQLDGLKDSYQKLAAEEADDGGEEEEEEEDGEMAEDGEENELDDEEDHVDPHGDQYIQQLAMKLGGGGGESESDDSEMAQTLTEIDYETVIDDEDVVDEFLLFKNTLHTRSQQDPEWYSLLNSRLSRSRRSGPRVPRHAT